MERETRFELATSTLARLHSTTELFPLKGHATRDISKPEKQNQPRKLIYREKQ
jgi:hypothetical protein